MHICHEEIIAASLAFGTVGTIWVWVKAEVYAVVAYFRPLTIADSSAQREQEKL